MGTKRLLASNIASEVEKLRPGPFLDLFAGISSAGGAVAPKRQIWCNDTQAFSTLLTGALYGSKSNDTKAAEVVAYTRRQYLSNLKRLTMMLRKELALEDSFIRSESKEEQVALHGEIMAAARERASDLRKAGLYSLFTSTHAGGYFGLRQCLELDSIRAGADGALTRERISSDQHRWAILALCRAISTISNSTGHFAQYLTPKIANMARVLSKRRRSAFVEWKTALHEFRPVGSSRWRSSNRIFNADANTLLKKLTTGNELPGVIYADPPYTNDQYSRFYHIFETAIKYDYPEITGKGEYRRNRFVSRFSLASEVVAAFEEMIQTAALLPSSLMISYPSDGLLRESSETILRLMRENFAVVRDPILIRHKHSTMGGSKGTQKRLVTEHIYLAERGLLAAQ